MDIGVDSAKELLHIHIFSYKDGYFQIGKSLPLGDRVAVLLALV